MIWGCHSFDGGKLHAIFFAYGSYSSVDARLKVIWKAITNKGITGYIYSPGFGKSKSIEKEIARCQDYGIIHGDINHDTHLYMLELASLRKIAREGETSQEVVRRLIEEHRLMANGQKDYTRLQQLNEEYIKNLKDGEKVLSEIRTELNKL